MNQHSKEWPLVNNAMSSSAKHVQVTLSLESYIAPASASANDEATCSNARYAEDVEKWFDAVSQLPAHNMEFNNTSSELDGNHVQGISTQSPLLQREDQPASIASEPRTNTPTFPEDTNSPNGQPINQPNFQDNIPPVPLVFVAARDYYYRKYDVVSELSNAYHIRREFGTNFWVYDERYRHGRVVRGATDYVQFFLGMRFSIVRRTGTRLRVLHKQV